MATSLQPPLVPKDGRILRVLGIARISTDKQNERSLDDQEALYRRWLADHYDGEFELSMIAGQGSGERLDRDEWLQACEAVQSRRYDLVIAEDLGRIARRMHVALFCEEAQDYDTRVITINDHVDTGREGWKLSAVFSSLHHEQHNEDTSKRIQRSLRNIFVNGGAVQCEIFGYIKPHGSSSDADLRKNPAAEPIIRHWIEMLEQGATFAEVADWLNDNGVATGPYCDSKKWTGPMVARLTRNLILSGRRNRNRMQTKRENSTGRRKSVKAPPSELLERYCPHLAFIDIDRHDRLLEMLAERNAACRRREIDGRDPRKQVPKKRTRFPGQTVYCGVCGRLYVYGGHGREAHLMCSGAREYSCWNGATVAEVLTRERVCEVVFSAIESLPEFDAKLLGKIRKQEAVLNAEQNNALAAATAIVTRLDRELENVMGFIRNGSASAAVTDELNRLERERSQARRHLLNLKDRRAAPLVLPSAAEIREIAQASFEGLAGESFEFARMLRRVVPRIVVKPYRLLDSNKVVLRARFKLRLSKLVPSPKAAELLASELDRVIEIDLFDPPQRETHRLELAELRKTMTEAQAAARCKITKTAAQAAARLQRLMDDQGLDTPYVPVTEPPSNSRKIRRHLHHRYKFDPLPDADEL